MDFGNAEKNAKWKCWNSKINKFIFHKYNENILPGELAELAKDIGIELINKNYQIPKFHYWDNILTFSYGEGKHNDENVIYFKYYVPDYLNDEFDELDVYYDFQHFTKIIGLDLTNDSLANQIAEKMENERKAILGK